MSPWGQPVPWDTQWLHHRGRLAQNTGWGRLPWKVRVRRNVKDLMQAKGVAPALHLPPGCRALPSPGLSMQSRGGPEPASSALYPSPPCTGQGWDWAFCHTGSARGPGTSHAAAHRSRATQSLPCLQVSAGAGPAPWKPPHLGGPHSLGTGSCPKAQLQAEPSAKGMDHPETQQGGPQLANTPSVGRHWALRCEPHGQVSPGMEALLAHRPPNPTPHKCFSLSSVFFSLCLFFPSPPRPLSTLP